MRETKSLPRANRVITLGKSLVWAILICGTLLSVLAATSHETAQKLGDTKQPNQNNNAECEELRKNVQQLSAQVDQLKKKVAQLEKYQQIDYLRDLLMKEEQRAGALQSQLLDINEKETALQTRIDQLDEQLRPENIDQALAGVGSLHPEDAREALRRRLSNERRRLQTQFDLLHQNRARLQAALATSDASVQRLRLRLNEAARP
jgi:uncharacterized protein YlxW (UPF0749 family)